MLGTKATAGATRAKRRARRTIMVRTTIIGLSTERSRRPDHHGGERCKLKCVTPDLCDVMRESHSTARITVKVDKSNDTNYSITPLVDGVDTSKFILYF